MIAPNVEAFRAELVRLYQYHPQAPAFISIDPEAGIVTHHFELKAGRRYEMAKHITIKVPGKYLQTDELTTFELVPQSYLSPRLSPYWCCSCSFLRKILVISAAAGVPNYWL